MFFHQVQMEPKNNSTKQRPNKQAQPTTRYLRDKATDDESCGSVEEYLIGEVVEPRRSLPQGTNATHRGQSPTSPSPR